MKCITCGTELEAGALICPHCGRVVDSADAARQKAAAGQLTKKEFYALPGMKSYRNNIKSCAILLYFCAGMTILASLLLKRVVPASLIDGILILALGLWLHFGKSRICAIITLLYGIAGTAYVALETGKVQGWWIPLAGVWAISYTFKFHKLWKKYQREGVLPDEAVSEK